ncbi:YbjN domain-containing protein [Cellulomonas sp. P22]|uniref:YbjN domain-containing protein n=1 Tax=Cellulomonas sp. P22 TaxID=3373189 RepID=UPI0037B7F1C5
MFSRPDAAAPATGLERLTHQRIVEVLEAQGFTYLLDDDGDICGRWGEHVFYFFLLGRDSEYLQVRGRWAREVGPSEIDALTAEANTWNLDKLWPKVYVRAEGSEVGVYSEHTVDYEHGVSDGQLQLHLACGISTALQFFAHLDELYPDAVAASRGAAAAGGPAAGA